MEGERKGWGHEGSFVTFVADGALFFVFFSSFFFVMFNGAVPRLYDLKYEMYEVAV